MRSAIFTSEGDAMTGSMSSTRTYWLTFLALIALTFLTLGLSFLRLGTWWHLVAGLGIGAVKATLVALFFMHLFHSPGRAWLAAALGVFWLGILFALTMSDYLTRALASY
jgi:cytochrome c oxidase subunit IV